MMHTGLDEKKRLKMVKQLQKLLANEFILYIKTLKFHWNIQGKHFHDLHLMLNDQYEQLLKIVDDIAERIRALGFEAIGTIAEIHQNATLPETPGHNPDEQGMLVELLEGYEAIIKQMRKDFDLTTELNDAGTNNFLGELIMKHEKTAWMLRSTIEH